MPSALATQIVAALQGLDAARPETVDALLPLYAQDIEFRDPIQCIRGLGEFIAMNKRLLARTRELTFDVKSVAGEGETIFLAWSMHAVPKLGPKIGVDGATHLVTRDGRVVVHRDYWDLGELVTSPVPRAHRLLQFFLKPLA
jgi:limonene-1,2-epoxide hydrolase